jgi:hypothetical protein
MRVVACDGNEGRRREEGREGGGRGRGWDGWMN